MLYPCLIVSVIEICSPIVRIFGSFNVAFLILLLALGIENKSYVKLKAWGISWASKL